MVFSCACFRPATHHDAEQPADVVPQQTVTHKPTQQVADAPPAGAAAVRSSAQHTKVLVVQRSSMRDVCTESDSPRKVAATAAAASAAAAAKDAPPSIWERLAAHEIRSITPEVQAAPAAAAFTTPERAPAPAAGKAAAAVPAVVGGASPASAASLQHPKPWGARCARSSGGAPGSPASPAAPGRRNSSGGGATPSSLLKPTAASAARAQATQRPKNDDLASWRH